MRPFRSSLRDLTLPLCVALTLGVATACGNTGAAPPTATVGPSASVAPVVAPSPPRPQFASPVASPSVAATTPSATATAEVAGADYEVAAGDTLLTIADKQLGDQTQWRRIYDANKDTIGSDPDKLKIGMKLKIPPKQS